MASFDLNPGDEILIYGAGQLGRQFYERVKSCLNVIAFLDINAESVRAVGNTPVYHPLESTIYKERTVIVCLHNALTHVEVAEHLNQIGFRKIIFIPAETKCLDSTAKSCMDQIYAAIAENELFHSQIPDYSDLTRFGSVKNVIAEYKNSVVTLVDVELLYVGSEKQPDQIRKRNATDCSESYKVAYDMFMAYAHKPVVALMPYVKFFTSMLSGESDLDDYNRMCKAIQNKDHVSDEAFLKDRYQVYRILELKYCQGLESFYNSPVKVEWNPKGYFETIDGNHRAVFLFCKGQRSIPVVMSKEDFGRWCNLKTGKKLHAFLKKNSIRTFVAPISSPLWRHIPYKRELANRNLIVQIMQFLDQKSLKNLSFIDLSDYNGYFARHFYRMGAYKSAAIDTEPKNHEISIVLNELLGTRQVVSILNSDRYSFNQKYHMAVIAESVTAGNRHQIIKKIDKNIDSLVFWEFSPESETVASVTGDTKFKNYEKLGNIYNEGRYHEFGVFSASNCLK